MAGLNWLDGLLGIKRLLAAGIEAVTRPAWNFIGVTVADNPAEDRTDITFVGTGVQPTRHVDSGNGLQGGGDLSVDRSISVKPNADGSIFADSNGTKVGVLATDVQHGARGYTTGLANLHSLATTSHPGFMSDADKTMLVDATAAATPGTIVLRDEAGQIFGNGFDAGGAVIADVGDPIDPTDAANKKYVDGGPYTFTTTDDSNVPLFDLVVPSGGAKSFELTLKAIVQSGALTGKTFHLRQLAFFKDVSGTPTLVLYTVPTNGVLFGLDETSGAISPGSNISFGNTGLTEHIGVVGIAATTIEWTWSKRET